ncbi:MAG TPA: metallophosphoesterase [Firmicutes bacterium]|nr:metallophosphoesterase [Bacillota bacterium]
MGFMLFAFVFAVARDAVLLLTITGSKLGALVHGVFGGENVTSSPDMGRRSFFVQASNVGIVAFAGGLTGLGLWSARKTPTVRNVEIHVPGLASAFDGFRIAQITDLHIGATVKRSFVESVARTVNELKADLIAVTGDLVDGSVRSLRDDLMPLGSLTAPFGTYFVTGNHEYYSGADQWVDYLRDELKWNVLLNEHRVLERGEERLVIAGVTDFSRRNADNPHRSDPATAIHGSPDGVPRVLLAHQPMSVNAAAQAGIDVQLSGHTHGGQFFPWNLVVHMVQPYVSGLNRHKNTQIYVSKGTGYWGPPLRVGAPSEVTLITLRADSSSGEKSRRSEA